MRMPGKAWIVTIAVIVAATAPAARAERFAFLGIAINDLHNKAVGQAQLSVETRWLGSGQVLMTFQNEGNEACSIADVYLDAHGAPGLIDHIDSLYSADPGVQFSMGARPKNLPGGAAIDPVFNASECLLFDSDSPTQPNGINPGESLDVLLTLASFKQYPHFTDAMYDGSLRVGIHVQGFDDGGSESFVNSPVPAPGAALLGGIGLCGIGLIRWRRRSA